MKWEYLVAHFYKGRCVDVNSKSKSVSEDLLSKKVEYLHESEVLDMLGSEGWELVVVTVVDVGGYDFKNHYYKRPLS